MHRELRSEERTHSVCLPNSPGLLLSITQFISLSSAHWSKIDFRTVVYLHTFLPAGRGVDEIRPIYGSLM